ncbi:response regulator transcription factor [Paenibacillus puerhi]|uniref:response regulator transcription factor n=1 Tax=Paenibacillus puerhi TaxID=2692622 RepID=UPI001358D2CF|nr:response regulator [Paenibacillus puerhi]
MFKLLVVDDEHDTRDTLCHCFPWESVGFTIVHQAGDGLEALQYMLEHPVDAVLCDIRMPGMTGLELCQTLVERQLPARVILLSAYREFEYARQAMQYGVRQYMVKPATYKDIVDVFTELRQELEAASESSPPPPQPHEITAEAEDPVIARISEYVSEHYRTATLQEAAELVHMNASYISSYYKKKTGRNFSELVLEARMQNAARLLKQTQLKAYEISERVGYVNPKNFIRSFKQYYGKTPGQFKHE